MKNLRPFSLILIFLFCIFTFSCYAQQIKEPDVAGSFYPADAQELSETIDKLLSSVDPEPSQEQIVAIIVPHAGYAYSGGIAAYAYKLIQGNPYKTVVIISSSHYHPFKGISIYPRGVYRTPLGDVAIDEEFVLGIVNRSKNIKLTSDFFKKEHPIEVQIPFLQKTLSDFKIVPISMGKVDIYDCQDLADSLSTLIKSRNDVLIVVSTDMYHGYDFQEAAKTDKLTLSYIEKMDAGLLYQKLANNEIQLCGGLPLVTSMFLAQTLGYDRIRVLAYTNSSQVSGRKVKGVWTVGYTSAIISKDGVRNTEKIKNQEEAREMLSREQKSKLLKLASSSIEYYLKNNKKLEVTESDPGLKQENGAFVTLHRHGQLRGCIGNLIGEKPLYLTIRDMAVEAAVGDPRFPPLKVSELNDIEIEISVLSPLKRINNPEDIVLGKHGVLVKNGFRTGVFLPQVATETGWSREEFLSYLCSHKAGLAPLAWKDKDTEIYIFTATVFSQQD